MDKTEQAFYEAHAVASLHLRVFANMLDGGADAAALAAQLELLNGATKAMLKLPRPQQQQQKAA